jgi:DNA mismatch repair protein MutS
MYYEDISSPKVFLKPVPGPGNLLFTVLYLSMINVCDLHFKKEILPLFDFLYNEFSRKALMELLSEIPDSVEEIYIRQDILKAFLQNKQLYAPFSYSKVEFNQVYGYLEDKKIGLSNFSGNSLKLRLLFHQSESNREKGGLHQLYYFLHKIYQSYFFRLDLPLFPETFRNSLNNILRMFSGLELEKYYAIGRNRGFNIKETVRLIQLLEEKIRVGEMDAFLKDLFLFEAYLSISKGIKFNNFTFPVFGDEALSIREFYHPLLKDPVRNSLDIKDSVTLITGPNMSGKSTLLRSIGLCVYLAHLGLGVPAVKCQLPYFDVISIAINLSDDLKNGYSHFMKEIRTLKQVVVEAHDHKRCFAIFDELFRGTNIEDALAISKVTITGLTSFSGSFFFISTHLHQLEQVAGDNVINTCYIECQLENGMPVFTYKLKPGWSDLKIGQIIFRQEGLNELLASTVP